MFHFSIENDEENNDNDNRGVRFYGNRVPGYYGRLFIDGGCQL